MSLYNKFRPMSWDAVIGQDGIVGTLKNMVATKEISSCFLFQGPRGTGKTTCARIFAKALNCSSPPEPGVPCGKCEDCVSIAGDESPNVIEIDAACFHRDVRVRLANGGSMRIGDIVSKRLSVEVMSYNFEKRKIEARKVIGWHDNGTYDKFLRVEFDPGYGERRSLSGVTPNHGIFRDLTGAKRPLREFSVGDTVLFACPSLNGFQLQVLAGTVVGDSSLTGGQGVREETNLNVILECSHNEKQWEYLDYKKQLLGSLELVDTKETVSGHGSKFKGFRSPCNEFLSRIKDEWFGGNSKYVSDSLLKSFTEVSLAFLYMDDGTLSDPLKDTGTSCRIYTNGKTEEEVDRLIAHLNLKWDLSAYKSQDKRRDEQYYISIGREGGKKFFDLIKSYVHPSMYYKLPSEYQGYFDTSIYDICDGGDDLIPVEITKIEDFVKGSKKEKSFRRFDIEVEGNHNYFVGRGCLVSNSNTGVDNMRDVKAAANLVGAGGGWKVYIIDEAHMLSKAAQNSALKMFEESPDKTVFVLATTEQHKLEGTIISRSLRFDFRPATLDSLVGRLKFIADSEGIEVDEPALRMIGKAASGGVRDSISILERVSLENGKKVVVESVIRSLGITPTSIMNRLGDVLSGNHKAAFEVVNEVVENGYDIYQFLKGCIDYFRDLIMIQMGLDNMLMVDSESLGTMRDVAGKYQVNQVTDAISVLEETTGRYRYAEDKRILTEIALYRVATGKSADQVSGGQVAVVQAQVNPAEVQQLVQQTIQGMNLNQVPQSAPAQVPNSQPMPSPQTHPDTVTSVPMQSASIGESPAPVSPPPQQGEMPSNLTDQEWGIFKGKLKEEDVDAGYSLNAASGPAGFRGNTLLIGYESGRDYYAQNFNDNYAATASRVLAKLMGRDVYVEGIVVESPQPQVDTVTSAPMSSIPENQSPPVQQGWGQPQEQVPVQQTPQQPPAQDVNNGWGHQQQNVATQSVMEQPQQQPVAQVAQGDGVTVDMLHAKFGFGNG